MLKQLECPICNGIAFLNTKSETNSFRKEDYKILAHFYKCENCKEEFSKTETSNLNVNQVYNQYREKHNIPLPKQIMLIRERYGLSASKMSLILGIGANQYSLYEKGDIPNESNSQLIEIISDPKVFHTHILKRKSLFRPKELDKIIAKVDEMIIKKKDVWYNQEMILFNPLANPSALNGYQMPSLQRFANMVIFFLKEAFLVTRLNKFLFYADFLNFKKNGYSISGYNYAAIPLGPVPYDYKTVYDLLEDHNYVSTEPYETDYDTTEKFAAIKEFDKSLFSENELNSLVTVKEKLSLLSTKEVIKMSHEELGWLENKDNKDLISYQKYAFLLKHF
jgi:putative zinc finger/helix-turn-helix YgiT family protein